VSGQNFQALFQKPDQCGLQRGKTWNEKIICHNRKQKMLHIKFQIDSHNVISALNNAPGLYSKGTIFESRKRYRRRIYRPLLGQYFQRVHDRLLLIHHSRRSFRLARVYKTASHIGTTTSQPCRAHRVIDRCAATISSDLRLAVPQ
jgi:hypothetical protein